MSTPLLSTKLYIPHARPNAVSRPRLIEKLLAGISQTGSLTLVSGPAGFGKTTLLSEATARLRQPVAWLSLDEADNDPNRFWTYLIAACQSVQPGIGETALALFHSPQPLPVETAPTILINDLARLGGNLVLVLDDYHVIQNQSIHAACAFLMDHLPAGLSVVLSTRVDPPWPLARFRARNQLIELRTADLRFTTEEAAAFLNQLMGLNLSSDDVSALEARTEGWIAGLQLAAISLQGRSDLAGFIKAFAGSHVYVAEYLVEEVLRREPEGVQAFLLQTSILERLNARLCEAVTEQPDGQAVLTALQRANLFVLPLDDEGQWFRYHHLFSDLLQARLRQTMPAEGVAGPHRRASAWFEANGFAVEAVNHALAAMDFEGAARLVEQYSYVITLRGELATVLQWIEALPGAVRQHHPQLLIGQAWTLTLAGDIRQVEGLLRQMEALASDGSPTPARDELLGNAAAIRGFFSMLAGDYARALELAEHAETLLPENSIQARSILPYTVGSAYRGQGQYDQAAKAFAREMQQGEREHDLLIWATGATETVNVARLRGRLREAAEAGRQALRRLAEQGAQPYGSLAKLEVALCEALREQNELAEASRRLTDVIGRMQAWDMPTDRLFAYLALFRVQEAQGDLSSARETLQIAQNLKASHPVLLFLGRSVDIYEIRLALATHDVATAGRLAEGLPAGPGGPAMVRDLERLTLARVRLAQGWLDEALAGLAALAEEAEAGGHWGIWLECLALQGCVLEAQGNAAAALRVLTRALAWAEPEGFVRVFVDNGERMQRLLAAVAHQLATRAQPETAPSAAYIARLLGAFDKSRAPDATLQSEKASASMIEPLTARELEVLQLIAEGYSNRAIAEKLVITVSAVKKHTGNIFGKLNVGSRTQAVARARQLGLLSADG